MHIPLFYTKNATCLLWCYLVAVVFIFGVVTGCSSPTDPNASTPQQTTAVQLSDLDVTTGQTIYVPAYSEMFITANRTIDLAVTLTFHNTDFENPIFLTSVRYYNPDGQLLREYLTEPQRLDPLAATEFFVEADEQGDGLGTNFVVEWVAEEPVFEPIVEAIMLNVSNNQGISITSPGRVISQIEPQPEQ